MRLKTNAFCLIFLLFFFSCSPSFCREGDLSAICQNGSLSVGRIRSYQFRCEIEARFHNPVDKPRTDIGLFWQSGDNIFVKTELFNPDNIAVDALVAGAIYTYNGSLYQWYIPGRDALSFSKQCRHPTPYWIQNPIIFPYYWFAGERANWSELKDKERWVNLFKEARYEGKKNENNVNYEVVSLPNTRSKKRIHVYFAKDIEYYPMKSLCGKKNKIIFSVEVKRYNLIDVDGQKTVFPLEIVVKDGTETEGLTITSTIDESSIKVNHNIDEDKFTLSPTMAKVVYDYDEELKKMDPSSLPPDENYLPPPIPNHQWTPKKFVVLLAINGVIIVLLLLLLLLRRKK
ncbi:MAG: hypothetical protein LBU65_03305 [Planctomycetaceae bacterium]|jgi:hypothetical protein|nr:hypothetical protein [Planctomycetaceae bacterium]